MNLKFAQKEKTNVNKKIMKENNKLLAEFLGWEQFGSIGLYDTTFHNDKGSLHWLTKNMRFHNDWNWLMQVVEKIESLGFEFFIVESRCRIAHNTDKSIETIIDFEILGTKIEAVYNACVEFVEWWNKESN